MFAYTVRIDNEGEVPVRLHSRYWCIRDSTGKIEEVRGLGVVGQQPYLKPGESFEYTSGCMIKTPQGEMHGNYTMQRADGTEFEAMIAPFALSFPMTLH